MFLSRALGAALLAVPLAGASGQSASQHPPPGTAGDSSAGHRFAWIASTGVASAAVFTAFVRLSEHHIAGAQSDPFAPGTPVPNRYTDGTLPGNGVGPGQDPPPTGDSASHGSGGVVGGNQFPDIIDTPLPPGPLFDLPQDTTSGSGGDVSGSPNGGKNDQPNNPLPPPGPETSFAVVVTTPEPETFSLLGTGLVALVPLVRRRRPRG